MEKKYAEYLLRKTCQDYNLIAQDFARTRRDIWEEMKFLFDDYLTFGEKVLDLGCGNGRWFGLFEQRGVDYLGIDSCEKLIDIAQKSYPRGKFLAADILNLPFPDNSFDKIYSIAVFHHIPAQEFRLKFLKETKRVLKPGGFLILTVWRFLQPKQRYLLFKYTILKIIGKSKLDWKDIFDPWAGKVKLYYHCFSKRELENLIKKSGLSIKEMGTVKNDKGNRQNIYLIAEK